MVCSKIFLPRIYLNKSMFINTPGLKRYFSLEGKNPKTSVIIQVHKVNRFNYMIKKIKTYGQLTLEKLAATSAGVSYYLDMFVSIRIMFDDVFVRRARCRCNAYFRNVSVLVVIFHASLPRIIPMKTLLSALFYKRLHSKRKTCLKLKVQRL